MLVWKMLQNLLQNLSEQIFSRMSQGSPSDLKTFLWFTLLVLVIVFPFLFSYEICFIILKTLTVCYYHVTYEFQSESTLYGCLNVKDLFAWNRRHIWSLSDSNGIRIHNHLVRKGHSMNGWVFVYELSGCGFESRCCHVKILP